MKSSLIRAAVAASSALALAASLAGQAPAAAPKGPPAPQLQIPAASPVSTLKQRVGLTDIEIVYARPGAKGRTMIGKVEPYGAVWRTGATNATTITFSTDVKLGGQAVPAGKYALFTIPTEKDWT